MTSEVVVMNRLAVALAADSAATVSGPSSQKIWNSANKLFALSKHRPVGVMVYNNASILGVPWETIIKSYRGHLGDTAFEKLEEYGLDFIRYLTGNHQLFPPELQKKYFLDRIRQVLGRLRKCAYDDYIAAIIRRESASQCHTFRKAIATEINRLEEMDDLGTSAAHTREAILSEFRAEIEQLVLRELDWMEVDADLQDSVCTLAALGQSKDSFGFDYTGLVFSGFGEAEYFPSMQSFRLGDVLLDHPKQSDPYVRTVSDDEPSIVEPFAQSDMVTTFLEGMNPNMRAELSRLFIGLALELSDTAIDAISDLDEVQKQRWKNGVRPLSVSAIRTMLGRLQTHASEAYWSPVHDALVHLPKDELAHVAEALVNLNSFQKKVSMEDETVGGPIDVAVISKGDGLIWIKRKHYFTRELNEHYFVNIQKGAAA